MVTILVAKIAVEFIKENELRLITKKFGFKKDLAMLSIEQKKVDLSMH